MPNHALQVAFPLLNKSSSEVPDRGGFLGTKTPGEAWCRDAENEERIRKKGGILLPLVESQTCGIFGRAGALSDLGISCRLSMNTHSACAVLDFGDIQVADCLHDILQHIHHGLELNALSHHVRISLTRWRPEYSANLCQPKTLLCDLSFFGGAFWFSCFLSFPFGRAPMGHTPSTAGTFRKKCRKNSGKTPETLSERFLEFSSRVRLGPPKHYNSRHLKAPEHFQNCLPPPVRLETLLFSEVVPERASQSRSWNSQQYWGYF